MTLPHKGYAFSPSERQLLPHLGSTREEIAEKTGLEEVTITKSLRMLAEKKLVILIEKKEEEIAPDINGLLYKKKGLPERQLLTLLEQKKFLLLEKIEKETGLSDNEIKVSLGALKSKGLIDIQTGRVILKQSPAVHTHWLEEQLLAKIPCTLSSLSQELQACIPFLQKRKQLILKKERTTLSYTLTEEGKKYAGKEYLTDELEEVTPELIQNWQGTKQFRAYNLALPVAPLYGGKRHFVQEAIEKAVRIWTDLGFTEMTGPLIDTEFWVFDALYTPQDHPGREMQDTFFLPLTKNLPDAKIVKKIQQAHEQGIGGSRGWRYTWSPTKAKQAVLRTHTTSLSARTLATIKQEQLPAKYFAIGKVFRNETLDWSHGFEFYQTEGIVIDEKATFTHLLGYLKAFYTKMGFEKIQFVPSFFPYTEPSVEIQVWHPSKKQWLELGGAGIFRPEVSMALLGKQIPILAWGQGFDRIIMDAYAIKDLREMYGNNLKQLRALPRGGHHG